MSHAKNRAERLAEMERLYTQRGFTDIEMAERLGVTRPTAYKDRIILEGEVPFIKDEHGRWRIDRNKYITAVRVNLNEALALYLAARKASRQTRVAQPHVANAVSKLAVTLKNPMAQKLVKAADTILTQQTQPERLAVIETITQAWVDGYKLQLDYHALKARHSTTHIVRPYLIEPSLWSDSIYLIGLSENVNKLIPFKLGRIERARITNETFEIPQEFDEQTLLHHAWGIWYAEQEPVEVVLRFRGDTAVQRLRESIWHPSEAVEQLENGDCLWRAQVAEWQEMLPWIRGWGADVEVLAPEGLREDVKEHVRDSAINYGITTAVPTTPTTRLLQLWGKTSQQSDQYHPALYHMLDVAHVAQQLLSSRATSRWRNVLGRALNTDPATLHEWLPWLIALHDIGKISVPFQVLNKDQQTRLEKQGFDFGHYDPSYKLHHTLVGRLTLDTWAKETFGKNRAWRQVFLDMVAGHHGQYQQAESREHRQWQALNEAAEWGILREQAITLLRQLLLTNEPATWPQPHNLSAAIVALTGFTILCDWLGSDGQYFTPQPFLSLGEYLGHSKEQARQRVDEAGFFAPTQSHAPTDFTDLFGWQPRPLQTAIARIPDQLLTQPSLTIIESLTGEGKTEAALTLARRIGQLRGTDELYVALPTTATSNAMFQRLQTHLRDRLQLPTTANLVHGQAFLIEDDLRLEPLANEPHEASAYLALEWFAPKKRALLAPFGVGTIDQAELAALNVKHNALRLIGLASKVIILDEVHAYDTYMTTIIEAMLQWLAALGTSVILLSATLPLAKRQQLMTAYTGQTVTTTNQDYPYLLSVNTAVEQHEDNPPPAQASKKIQLASLHLAQDDAPAKAAWLLDQITAGGTICWLTNTVNRAQELFTAVQTIAPPDIDLLLLHGRFPLNQRQIIETAILDRYGPQEQATQRPPRGIVIGTQVLEQSLDLDFDLMVSDLAPIDLLLQRVGRLHRHPRRTNRSPHHPTPRFWVNAERNAQGNLKIGADKFYTEYILLKSWEAIQERINMAGLFDLPHDYRPLIEHVYSEAALSPDSTLRPAWDDWFARQDNLEKQAKLRLANPPDAEDPFYEGANIAFREDEDSNAWLVAQTRYIERETLTIIPLERVDESHFKLLGEDEIYSFASNITRGLQLKMLQYSVKISDPQAVRGIKNLKIPTQFEKASLVKYCYPLMIEKTPHANVWKSIEAEQTILLDLNLGVVFDRNNSV